MGHLCDSVDSRQWTGAAGYTATQQGGAGGGGPADDTCRYIRLNQGAKKQDVGGIGAAEWLYQYLVLTCPAKFHVGKICTLPFIVQIFGEGNVKAETICDILTFLHPFIKRNIFSNPISSLSPGERCGYL